jgi:hypothetical protein
MAIAVVGRRTSRICLPGSQDRHDLQPGRDVVERERMKALCYTLRLCRGEAAER